jgi:hypothetical protein
MDAFNDKVVSITRTLNTGVVGVNRLRRSLRGGVDGVRSSLTKVKIVLDGVVRHKLDPLLANFNAFNKPRISPRQHSILLIDLTLQLPVLELVGLVL